MSDIFKKDSGIEAIKYTGTGESFEKCDDFCEGILCVDNNGNCIITTLEGDMTVSVGDWIIKGVQGEFYPCKPDIFKQTYE